MATRYLLPCSCGNKLAVDSGQAGLPITCTCGAALEVPTIRGLGGLESIGQVADATARPAGGILRRATFVVGLALALLGGSGAAFQASRAPKPPQVHPVELTNVRRDIERMTLTQSFAAWDDVKRQGIGTPRQDTIDYESTERRYLFYTRACWAVVVIGGVLAIGSFLIPRD